LLTLTCVSRSGERCEARLRRRPHRLFAGCTKRAFPRVASSPEVTQLPLHNVRSCLGNSNQRRGTPCGCRFELVVYDLRPVHRRRAVAKKWAPHEIEGRARPSEGTGSPRRGGQLAGAPFLAICRLSSSTRGDKSASGALLRKASSPPR
jgi:hypothetical protein